MKRSAFRLGIILSVFVMFLACQKETSIENGGFGGTASGELVDSLGNCKSSIISGEYKVDTLLVTGKNYSSINVNFTSTGKYKIYTDTVNGMWFIDSGYALSTGASVIKLKGYGKPILPKATSFTIYFNNNTCSFTITVGGTVSGGTGGTGGGGTSGTGSNGDYFPTTSGSVWAYQYLPKLGIDSFTVTAAVGLVTLDSLSYAKFGTSQQDTFYFAKDGKGNYYEYSTIDFDYTLAFDSIPSFFITYPFLKESAAVATSWESPAYGPVKTNGLTGYSKAVFTVMSKGGTYTIGGKTYSNVIQMKRDIMFVANGNTTYQTLFSGYSYYAYGYGLIDQVLLTTPGQAVSILRTPTIK